MDESELSAIVFFSMIFSILSLIFSIGRQTNIFCKWLNPPQQRFNKTLKCNVELTISSDDLKWHHSFANHKIQECITKVLYNCKDLQAYCHNDSRSDIKIEIEVFYIENNIIISNNIKNIIVHFMLDVYFHTNHDAKWDAVKNLFLTNIDNLEQVGHPNRDAMIKVEMLFFFCLF